MYLEYIFGVSVLQYFLIPPFSSGKFLGFYLSVVFQGSPYFLYRYQIRALHWAHPPVDPVSCKISLDVATGLLRVIILIRACTDWGSAF